MTGSRLAAALTVLCAIAAPVSLAHDGCFMLTIPAPKRKTPPLPRDLLFVVDNEDRIVWIEMGRIRHVCLLDRQLAAPRGQLCRRKVPGSHPGTHAGGPPALRLLPRSRVPAPTEHLVERWEEALLFRENIDSPKNTCPRDKP